MKYYIVLIIDIFIVFCSLLIVNWIKPGSNTNYLYNYSEQFIIFLIIWGLCSFLFKKYNIFSTVNGSDNLKNIILSNIFSFALVTSIMFITRIDYFSRMIVIGTIGVSSIFEIILSGIYFSFVKAEKIEYDIEDDTIPPFQDNYNDDVIFPDYNSKIPVNLSNNMTDHTFDTVLQKTDKKKQLSLIKNREKTLLVEINPEAFRFIFSYAHLDSPFTLIISTNSRFNIDMQIDNQFESIVNIERMNDVRYINKFFESANSKLTKGGLFISFVETKDLRKKRLLKKFPPVINYIYYSFDFLVKRVFPKFLLTKKLYFFITRGQNRVITKAEVFGRLYSCGFEIIAEKQINNHLYFVSRKIKNPLFPEQPSYGPLIRLERIGKNGKIISVYKMRTMHPYAEFLQQYVYETVGLDQGGKFKNDFRVSTIGRIMRMFWLDEVPMIINLLKGDLKLVGVRPLSRQYFGLYTKELQEKRIKVKPGLIPPFYVDFPKTLEEIMASELKYINNYEKHPFITDVRYFFLAFFNIIFKRYRSK